MPLEDLEGNKYISDLNPSWPAGSDFPDAGDNHIRGVKNVLLRSFPSITGPVTATQDELNALPGDVQQNKDDIAECVKLAGSDMTGVLGTPAVAFPDSDEGPRIYSGFSTSGKRDIFFRTGDATNGYNYVRMGEQGGLNLKTIIFRPDPSTDALGPYITSGYYSNGSYSLKLIVGNDSASYPWKEFNFGQNGNANFPGDLTVAGRIISNGGFSLPLSGEESYAVHVGETVVLPQGQFTYISLVEENGKPVLRFGHRPMVGSE